MSDKKFQVTGKLTKTSGGLYLRMPNDVVEAYDLEERDLLDSKIKKVEKDE